LASQLSKHAVFKKDSESQELMSRAGMILKYVESALSSVKKRDQQYYNVEAEFRKSAAWGRKNRIWTK
jgi:hypothetical protein